MSLSSSTTAVRWFLGNVALLAMGLSWMLLDASTRRASQHQRAPVVQAIVRLLGVAGSDVTGPMGKALVPVAGRDAAEQFKKDHYGTRIFTADEITTNVLREIAGKAPTPSTQ
jgi:hypothetical protein